MKIRKYQTQDGPIMAQLFYETINTINAKDYVKIQLQAWADGNIELEKWNNTFVESNTLIMELNATIVGFGNINDNGYLDCLYVHKDYQGQGIGRAIVTSLEQEVGNQEGILYYETYSSITAKPFFEQLGYRVIKENIVERKGVNIPNFLMKKKKTD